MYTLFQGRLTTVQEWTNFNTRTGAQKLIDRLISIKILEIKDQTVKYGRAYVYKKYVDIFEKSMQ